MRTLSKKEWIAVVIAVILVAYTLFGVDIANLFQKNQIKEDTLAGSIFSDSSVNNNGVIIDDILIGQGAEVKAGKLVSVHYILSLSDGTAIQNSKDFGQPFNFIFGAGDVIPGWEIGLTGMKVGGVRTIAIPPELAYGSNQVGPIPPNSTLVFTIELLEVTDAPAQTVQ